MPAWTNPTTHVDGNVVGATLLNTDLRDNPLYLFTRPYAGTIRDNGATYTTTSDSFTNIDGTNLSKSIYCYGTRVQVTLSGVLYWGSGSAVGGFFDVTVDGTRIGAAGVDGLMAMYPTATSVHMGFCFVTYATVTANASHTFNAVWRRSGSGTVYLISGNTPGTDFLPNFHVEEVG